MGHIAEYDHFLAELSRVWAEAFRVLVPGGRLVCVVGDVCLSRRENNGRHTVVPLHADICVQCRKLGFDNLNPIIWHKISNASYEVSNGSKFLGKPYKPNAIIKNDIEFILMQRKPGGYRKPAEEQRRLSMIPKDKFDKWFQQFWTITGASTKEHPAPFPFELASSRCSRSPATTEATAGELPAYARGRLQSKVRQTLGRPPADKEPDRSLAWGWRWLLGLAPTAVIVILLLLPIVRTPNVLVIQLAMLDMTGGTRGTETDAAPVLHQTWTNATLAVFTNLELLHTWETNWSSKQNNVKIIYDPAAAEVRVLGKYHGKSFQETFPIVKDFPSTLNRVKSFVAEQTRR